MSNEFNNRIDAQREVLELVNSRNYENEKLFGLSKNAINRWVVVNKLDIKSDFVELIKTISQKLFFLATKSQEQVTEEYKSWSQEVSSLIMELENEIEAK